MTIRRRPLWITEIGWGSAPPDQLRDQPGARRASRSCSTAAFKLILASEGSGTSSACSGSTGAIRRHPAGNLQLLRERRAAHAQPGAQAGPGDLQELHGRPEPPDREHLVGAQAGDRDQEPDARPSGSDRASPARPSSAASAAGRYAPCASPSTPSSRSRTAPRSSGLGRWTRRATWAPWSTGRSPSTPSRRRCRITSGPANGSTSHNDKPSFKFTASESNVKFQCQFDGGGSRPAPRRIPGPACRRAALVRGHGDRSGRERRPHRDPGLDAGHRRAKAKSSSAPSTPRG